MKRTWSPNKLYYSAAPTATSRGDFEDATGAGFPSANGTSAIAIPEINVQLKSEPIVAKTRKLKAQWTPEFTLTFCIPSDNT